METNKLENRLDDKLDESSRLVGAISWSAIASGVFIALALQMVLLLLGLAFGMSVGDKTVAGGYALWAVIAQLFSIAVGAALAARISHANRTMAGVAAGVLTWAVALVIGGAFQGVGLAVMQAKSGTAWAAFLGALLGLGAACLGGAIGATMGRRRSRPSSITGEPIVQSHTQQPVL